MLNLTNHPYAEWPEAQRMAAIGDVTDAPFPHVAPDWSPEEIVDKAYQFATAVADWAEVNEETIALVDGHAMMAMSIVSFLQARGIKCVSVRSPRDAEDNEDGSTTYRYNFEGWREWPEVELPQDLPPGFPFLDTALTKIKDVNRYNAEGATDAQLMDDHRIVHAWMATINTGKDFKHPKTTVQRLHDDIVREVIDRGFRHYLRSDMDKVTIDNLGERYIDAWTKTLKDDLERYDPAGEKAADAKKTLHALSKNRALSAISKLQKMLEKAPINFKPSKPGHRLIDLEEDLEDVKEEDVVVQVKFDGIRIIAMRSGETIHILSEDQLYEKKDKLPTLVKELKSLGGGDFILDAEALLRTEDGKDFEYRTEIAGVLNVKKEHEREGDVWLLIFDILKDDGKDLKNLPLEERLEHFDGFKSSTHVKFVGKDPKYSRVLKGVSKKKLEGAINKVTESPASEGAMIKGLQSKYSDTDQWYKYKQEFELDAMVVEKRKAGTGAWTYGLAIGPISAEYALGLLEDDKVPSIGPQGFQLGPKRGESNPPIPPAVKFKGQHWMVVGRAFNSGLDIPIGGILRVASQQVLETDIGDYKHYTVFLPRPIEDKSDDRVRPDSIDIARRLSKKSLRRVRAPEIGKFIRKKEEERGERLSDEIMDAAKDGEPLPEEHYKYPDEIRNVIKQGRKFKGWAQFHYRGMPDRGDPFKDHSVHCDVRLELPKSLDNELIQYVLAGKQDKIIRGILGLTNPATDSPQSLMAIIKPSAFEAGARVQQLVIGKGLDTQVIGGEGFDFGFKKQSVESLTRRLSGKENDPIRTSEEVVFPMKGYWISPDDPVNFSDVSWQYLQLIEEFEWLPGVQRTNAHEFFFYGKYFKGRYVLRALKGGTRTEGEPFWLWIKPVKDQKPMDPGWHRDEGALRPLYPKQLQGKLG